MRQELSLLQLTQSRSLSSRVLMRVDQNDLQPLESDNLPELQPCRPTR